MNTPLPPDTRRRNRITLLAILGAFLVSIVGAGVMRFADIHPEATRQKGELLDPYGDLRAVTLRRADGAAYPWNPVHRTWRILVPVPARCDDDCTRVARDLGTVSQLLAKDASRVDVLWWCEAAGCKWPGAVPAPIGLTVLAPQPEARRAVPQLDAAGGVPVYVVDPNGFVVLRYAPGADLAGLRSDLSRLLKLR